MARFPNALGLQVPLGTRAAWALSLDQKYRQRCATQVGTSRRQGISGRPGRDLTGPEAQARKKPAEAQFWLSFQERVQRAPVDAQSLMAKMLEQACRASLGATQHQLHSPCPFFEFFMSSPDSLDFCLPHTFLTPELHHCSKKNRRGLMAPETGHVRDGNSGESVSLSLNAAATRVRTLDERLHTNSEAMKRSLQQQQPAI